MTIADTIHSNELINIALIIFQIMSGTDLHVET